VQCHLDPTQDTFALLAALDGLWRQAAPVLKRGRPNTVGVNILNLKPRAAFEADLFSDGPDMNGNAPSLRLSQAMDELNKRFGKDTISIGPNAGLPAYIGAKIAFNRIPDEEDFWE